MTSGPVYESRAWSCPRPPAHPAQWLLAGTNTLTGDWLYSQVIS